MAESLSPLQYGTVVGRFLVELGDSVDSDLKPDVLPARGFMVFTPATSYANVKTAQPDPTTIFPQSVYAVLDSEGYLCSVEVDQKGIPRKTIDGSYIPVERGIRIQSSSDPNISPTGWTWRVMFNLNFSGSSLPYESFSFTLGPNEEVDLAFVKPVSHTGGTITITGPKGEQGLQGPRGETGPTNSLSIGAVTTVPTGSSASASIMGDAPNQTLNLGLPRGAVGPSGGPIPAGGTDGQIIRKNSSGGFEWFTPSGLVNSMVELDDVIDLNDIRGEFIGRQRLNVNAATSRNYPVGVAGLLQAFGTTSTHMLWQIYTTYGGTGRETGTFLKQYFRSAYLGEWSNWIESVRSTDLATSSVDGLMTASQFSQLSSATSGASGNSLVQRTASGDATFSNLYSSSTTQPTGNTAFIKRAFHDSQMTEAKNYAYVNSTLLTSDLNSMTTPGSYFVDGTAQNAPGLAGLKFGGHLEVFSTTGGGLSRGYQKLTITVVRPDGASITDHGSNGSDFFGLTFSRGFINTTFYPWSMEGETPSRTTGITSTNNIAQFRIPMHRAIRNGNLRVWGTFDLATGFRAGNAFNMNSYLACETKQVTAATEAVGGWGKVQISGTAGSVYVRDPGVNWVTFEGEWKLSV